MKVRELRKLLEDWPDQEATVVISEGAGSTSWLIATGVIERRITPRADNPDFAGPGNEPGIEII